MRRFKGSGNHFNNFITAVLSGKQSDLHCPILEGHLSSGMCHLTNISYRLGKKVPLVQQESGAVSDVMDLQDAFARFGAHLESNITNWRELAYQRGPRLSFDPTTETFVGDIHANSLLKSEYRQPFAVTDQV